MQNIFYNRIKKLSNKIDRENLALLITKDESIGYLCGFFHSEGVMLVTTDQAYLFVDFRYAEAAEKKSFGCRIVSFSKLYDELCECLKTNGIDCVSFEASNITVSKYNAFSKFLSDHGIECVADDFIDDALSTMRIVKDDYELGCIRQAQSITEKSYLEVLNYLKPGVTEREISARIEYLIKLNGGEDISFDLITITGKKTSLPHGVPSDDVVREGDFFTFDIGSIYNGYHSDTTRTVAIGSASDEMCEIYETVLKAQLCAVNKVCEGITCGEVDSAARSVIVNAGYGKCFGHSTGHGVGVEIHELPNVSPKSDSVLKSGMVITVEPGIYLPDKFGVRIEDMVYVTENGCKNLVSLTKELIII